MLQLQGITLLSLSGKVYARVLERRVHPNRPSVKLVLFCNELSCLSSSDSLHCLGYRYVSDENETTPKNTMIQCKFLNLVDEVSSFQYERGVFHRRGARMVVRKLETL